MHSEEEKTAAHWLKETKKGYIRIAVLILLGERPYHGYEIMREIGERTLGFWRPTAGGIYPILRSLEKSGYIEGEWDLEGKRRRKTYRVTKAGRLVLERALAKERQIASSMTGLFKEFMKDVLDIRAEPAAVPRMPNLFSAFLEERRGKPEDTRAILEDKRKQLAGMIEELQRQLQMMDKRLAQPETSEKRGATQRKAQ